ncbi:MAG: DUF362 domain-containing protein [Thermoanaerobacteraceae bacterium]|nr:DUF362 domain-containing protein [Thermoanaerobacteraceae bacterium]
METVAIRKCSSYEQNEVENAVSMVISDLGGIEKYIKPGDKVFLKINLLMKKKPEEAVTTHPAVIEAVIRKIQGAGGRVLIGDSPGGPYNERALKTIYRICGIDKVAEKTGAELNFDTSAVELQNPSGKILKNITMIKPVADANVVVSIPKLKTHNLTTFTGAVKLMFGCIPGNLKAEYHVRMPELKDFADALVDICMLTKPHLVVMDAVEAMEGEGPSGGTPKKLGCILASSDPFYLDGVAADIIGLKSDEAPTIKAAMKRGIYDPGNLKLVGDNKEEFKTSDFKIPTKRPTDMLSDKVPVLIKPFIKRYIRPRPVFDWDRCRGCGDCADNCPARVIEMIDNRPHVNYDDCISCFCCQELCMYRAVEVKRPWLSKFIFLR